MRRLPGDSRLRDCETGQVAAHAAQRMRRLHTYLDQSHRLYDRIS